MPNRDRQPRSDLDCDHWLMPCRKSALTRVVWEQLGEVPDLQRQCSDPDVELVIETHTRSSFYRTPLRLSNHLLELEMPVSDAKFVKAELQQRHSCQAEKYHDDWMLFLFARLLSVERHSTGTSVIKNGIWSKISHVCSVWKRADPRFCTRSGRTLRSESQEFFTWILHPLARVQMRSSVA